MLIMEDDLLPHEAEAREEVRHECERLTTKAKEAIYEVLTAYPTARLVRGALNAYSIETLGEKPGQLATAGRADIAWQRAAKTLWS